MNPDSLLKHFDQISEAPDAVPRLRRFILDLAVRGKLVPQDPNDEPASELLKRIEVEKTRLVKTVKSGNEMSCHHRRRSFRLTFQNWLWTRLGNVTTYIQRGNHQNTRVEMVFCHSQKCIQWAGLHLEWAKKITPESLESYEAIRFLRDGDLLLNSTGTGTIGRVIRVDQPGELVCDSHVTVYAPSYLSMSIFVRIWLSSDHVYGTLEGAMRCLDSTRLTEHSQQSNFPSHPSPNNTGLSRRLWN